MVQNELKEHKLKFNQNIKEANKQLTGKLSKSTDLILNQENTIYGRCHAKFYQSYKNKDNYENLKQLKSDPNQNLTTNLSINQNLEKEFINKDFNNKENIASPYRIFRKGVLLKYKKSPPKDCSMFIDTIPIHVTDSIILKLFSHFGPILDYKV